MTRALVLLALFAACRCEPPPRRATTPGDGAPEAALVEAMPDPYAAVPARGALDPVERAARVFAEVGKPFGWGENAAASLRAHGHEAWAKRVALLVDYGGTEQLSAAWLDLEDSLVSSPHVDPDLKLKLRQSEARVNDDRADQAAEPLLRKRLLAEIAWSFAGFGAMPRDGGSDDGPPAVHDQ